ncbi:hypothetical protein QDX21_07090 [Auritidibacter ignavus]|uniref:DUF4355 domain-containing protein n=1 Tax=Auritidibacter ignavus TaxID=678932 RepID=A0AAJ6DB13_9MICC|nr:hypothetical protein [Auritidibacter ignavus]WGH92100.1 hypothetical protein QDX21_07090 [Auritidibacter ignavus]
MFIKNPSLVFADSGDETGGSDLTETGQEDQSSTTDKNVMGDRGYPADTPLSEMTDSQKVAYWKYHSQKWEGRAKQRSDYDDIKAELDKLKTETLSEHEKAIKKVREETRAEVTKEHNAKLASAQITGALQGKGLTSDAIESRLQFVDFSKFLTGKGDVDADKVAAYLDGVAPVQEKKEQYPDMGAGRVGSPSGKQNAGTVQAGKDLHAARHK